MLCAALGGPLPASITQLRSLEALSLESNAFNGSLPPNLCRDMTALRVRVVLVGEAAGGVCVWGGTFLHRLEYCRQATHANPSRGTK